MPVDVSAHPDFRAKQAHYQAEKQAAVTAGDEVAIAKAESQWAVDLSHMNVDMYERQDQSRQRESQIARIKAENPQAPDEIFALGDVEQIERAAKAVQAVANQHSGGGTWSPAPGGGGAPPSAEPTDERDPNEQRVDYRDQLSGSGHYPSDLKKMDELAKTVMRKGAAARDEAEELERLALEPITSRFQVRNR